MHTVVAGALVRGGQVLLVHRHPARRWYPDVWDLPGGHVEDGEIPLAALVRELHEELGVHVDPAGCSPAVDVLLPGSLDLRIWHVRAWTGTPENRTPDEHDVLGWFAPGELAGLALAHESYPALLGELVRG